MKNTLSRELSALLERAREEAMRMGNAIDADHLSGNAKIVQTCQPNRIGTFVVKTLKDVP